MNPVQCNICEAAVAKFHCNTCGDTLCATCKVHHLKSKGSKHHKIVPYAEKLNPKHLAGLICPKHQANAPKFWCDKCGVPICDTCITNEHKGHPFSDITDLLAQTRDEMLAEMKTLRDKNFGEWEAVLKQAKKTTADYLCDIDEVSKELVARAKSMHEQVEAILAESQQTLQKIKESGLEKLKSQEEYLDKKLRQLKVDVARYEDQLTHGDPNALIQFKQSDQSTPSLETATPPVFQKGQNDIKAVQTMFGQLSALEVSQKSGGAIKTSSEGHLSPQPTVNSDITTSIVSSSSDTKPSLIQNPSVQSQFDVDTEEPCIACVDHGLAWVQNEEKLQLMDREGLVKETINSVSEAADMAMTSDGELLLAYCSWVEGKCIKSVSKKKKIATLFETDKEPCGLCCLQNNEIALTFADDNKVIVYSRNGEIRRTLDCVQFRNPKGIAASKVNKNIYICDKQWLADGSVGKLLAIGADGQLHFEYSGQSDHHNEFSPTDVCTDHKGHVLIVEFWNCCVHMLDQDGQFIQYILTSQQGLNNPINIDVDREGYLWVGEVIRSDRGRIKVVRYLQ